MAVAFDAVGPAGGAGTNSSTTPLTWTHVNGGSATAIVVAATTFTGGSSAITSVTYGGHTMTSLGFVASGGLTAGGIEFFYLDVSGGMPTGSNTVSISFTGAADTIAGSVSFTGSKGGGSSGHSSLFSAQPTSGATATVNVTGTTTGGMICTAACFGGGGSTGVLTGTNSVTARWALNVSGNSASDNAAEGTVPSTGGGATQTVGWNAGVGASDNWGVLAIEILPPAVATPSLPQAIRARLAVTPQGLKAPRGRTSSNPGGPVNNPVFFSGPPVQKRLPNYPVVVVINPGWRNAGHSR